MNLRSAPIIACLALGARRLLVGGRRHRCGLEPGRRLLRCPNINVGNVNPWAGSYQSQEYSSLGWRTCRQLSETVADAPRELICGSSFRLLHSLSASCLEHSGRHETVSPRLTAFYRTYLSPEYEVNKYFGCKRAAHYQTKELLKRNRCSKQVSASGCPPPQPGAQRPVLASRDRPHLSHRSGMNTATSGHGLLLESFMSKSIRWTWPGLRRDRSKITELVAEVSVPRRALLSSVGWALGTTHVENDVVGRFAGVAAFAKPEIYERLEQEGIRYAIRLPANDVLQRADRPSADAAGRAGRRRSRSVSFASFRYQAKGWTQPRRVVAKVEWHQGELYPRVGFIVTNLSRPSERVVKFYNGRGTAEQWIKEGKYALRWTRLSCRAFRHNTVRLQLHALAYNIANFLRTLALPKEVEQWSLTTLREKLVKIGARIVRHGRYVVFQLAEVAVPRVLFAKILRRIDGLRLRSPPFPA